MNIKFFSFPFSTLRHVYLWASKFIYSFIQQLLTELLLYDMLWPQGEQSDKIFALMELIFCGRMQTRSTPTNTLDYIKW